MDSGLDDFRGLFHDSMVLAGSSLFLFCLVGFGRFFFVLGLLSFLFVLAKHSNVKPKLLNNSFSV